VAQYVADEMGENARTAVTPERLYEIRKVLVDKLSGPHTLGDELGSAARGAERETMQLVKALDEALDQASNGQWSRYLQTHTRASRPVDASVAAGRVRQTFQGEGIPEVGNAPEVTLTRLGRAMDTAGGPASRKFQQELSPSARGGLDEVVSGLRRAGEVQKTRKLAGTGGGGSQTSMDLEGVIKGLGGKAGFPLISPLVEGIGGHLSASTRRELAQLMQNPEAAMQALQAARMRNQPLSEAMRAFLQVSGAGAGTGVPALTQTQ
jgi:hypothetical protein